MSDTKERRIRRIKARMEDLDGASNVRRWRDRVIVEYDGDGYQITSKNLKVSGGFDHREFIRHEAIRALEPNEPRERMGFPSVAQQQLEGER